MKVAYAVLAVGMGLVGTGCASTGPGPTRTNAAVARFESVGKAEVFAAAEEALAERFHIDRRDPAAGVLVAQPREGGDDAAAGTLRRVRGGKDSVRRTADIRVESTEGGVMVFCKVLVQQLESDARETFVRDRGTHDAPNETPIERDAGATPEQNQVWTTRRRDRLLEQDIIRSMRQKLGLDEGAALEAPS